MKTLDEISLEFGTDKSSAKHNYTKLYSLYFGDIRLEKLKILEIGVDKGFSLKSWKKYFPNSEITGIDIINLKYMEEERIHIEQGDQADPMFLTNINNKYGPFDIIIDDGSHYNENTKKSFECLFPMLKKGGLYIVEDLHAFYKGGKFGEPIFIDKLKEIIDLVNSSGKSGTGNIQRDSEWNQAKMDWWEKNVEFLHLYRSIVFIKKYPSFNDSKKYIIVAEPKKYNDLLIIRLARKIKSFLRSKLKTK